MNKRSIGVTIFGWFYIISSFTGVAQGLQVLSLLVLNKTEEIPAITLLFLLVEFAFNIAIFFIGLGVLGLNDSARKSAICCAIFLFLLAIVECFVFPAGEMTVQTIVKMLGVIIVSIFFTRHKVKMQFKPKVTESGVKESES